MTLEEDTLRRIGDSEKLRLSLLVLAVKKARSTQSDNKALMIINQHLDKGVVFENICKYYD